MGSEMCIRDRDVTLCCNQDVDRNMINVNDEHDWELVEKHIEEHLRMYTKVETMTPVSCKECGRLIEYVSHLKRDKKHFR